MPVPAFGDPAHAAGRPRHDVRRSDRDTLMASRATVFAGRAGAGESAYVEGPAAPLLGDDFGSPAQGASLEVATAAVTAGHHVILAASAAIIRRWPPAGEPAAQPMTRSPVGS
ncbi:MAG: hypothetical protein ACRCYX_05600 [Dermatophilaceae bacterium]